MAAARSPRWLRSTAPTASPYAGLIMDSSGNLYGTTPSGGTSGDGTVFELAQGSGTITTLASFNGTNGEDPLCRPDHGQQRQSVRHNDHGGARTTARFSSWPMAAARSPRWLRSTAPTVQGPYAGLIMDSSGNLYGTTYGRCGALATTARFSSWPKAAARSPRWLRSTATTVHTRIAA